MICSDEYVFYKILLLGFHAAGAYTFTSLCSVTGDGDAFYITLVGNGDNHILVGYQVFYLKLIDFIYNLCSPLIPVFVSKL